MTGTCLFLPLAGVLLLCLFVAAPGCVQGTGPVPVDPGATTPVPSASIPAAGVTIPAISGTTAGPGAGNPAAFLTYQPKKCEKTPWQAWEENSGRRYIRAPTDAEIITHYYAAVYNISVSNVEKAYLHMASCDACGVCSEDYWFELTTDRSVMQPLLVEGWQLAE
jgi:hypothetical protein